MSLETRTGYEGTGPGAITPDGCAVELYSRLPVEDEPDIVAGAVPAGARVLELGCGVGRVTHALIERGFEVTAVDESPEMLERVRGARTVRSTIEGLDLGGERFDVVLLASLLVNTGDAAVRRGMLDTVRRHVADDGCVLIQRVRDGAYEDLPRERHFAETGLTIRMVSSEPIGGGVRSAKVEYLFPDAEWTQTYRVLPMTLEEFEQALAEAGLKVDRCLTDDRVWVRAVPA
ncbi:MULTISPECIES: class I SAM-dependent methyltransferase [unclassified Streptomyces]|uniref:class I SAM-dependent methyltransferase n=1 Tax=unclassified Streptomyces TaxID=2593676 RepID=UPI000DBA2932|nr:MULTISPECIES: class I SAM-dependent methyltransferase [unclassified Streptomyces]MYT70426.1 methyltransferase domain-containing protein [Streptomyces sp. SID8367]